MVASGDARLDGARVAFGDVWDAAAFLRSPG
jgi:hypothetical protein